MKKLFAVAASFVLACTSVFGLVACGNDDKEEGSTEKLASAMLATLGSTNLTVEMEEREQYNGKTTTFSYCMKFDLKEKILSQTSCYCGEEGAVYYGKENGVYVIKTFSGEVLQSSELCEDEKTYEGKFENMFYGGDLAAIDILFVARFHDKFVYDGKNTYTYSDENAAAFLTVENGKMTACSVVSDTYSRSYSYRDIGTTVVTIP